MELSMPENRSQWVLKVFGNFRHGKPTFICKNVHLTWFNMIWHDLTPEKLIFRRNGWLLTPRRIAIDGFFRNCPRCMKSVNSPIQLERTHPVGMKHIRGPRDTTGCSSALRRWVKLQPKVTAMGQLILQINNTHESVSRIMRWLSFKIEL